MHDTLDEQLAQLGGSLEDAVGVKSPTAVRTRGDQFRVAHRRRVMAATATSAAVAIVGVGSFVALRPGGGHRGGSVAPGGGTHGSTPSASAPVRTAGAGALTSQSEAAPPAGSVKATVVVDLKQDMMTVRDKNGQVVKTLPVTGGAAEHPTPIGTFTVVDKKPQKTLSSTPGQPTGPDTYTLTVKWVIELGGGGPSLYASPWAGSYLGHRNTTHGDVGLSDEAAEWLYNYVAVGDRIQIR